MKLHDIYYDVLELPNDGIITNLAISNSLNALSFQYTITEEQRLNLIKLAYFLHSQQMIEGKFNMGTYCSIYEDRPGSGLWLVEASTPELARHHMTNCGACGCAVGWAAYARIGDIVAGDKSWVDYANRSFGVEVYDTCFRYHWTSDKEITANRILWCAISGNALESSYVESAAPIITLALKQLNPNWDVVKEYLDSVTETTQSPSLEQASQLDSIQS